MKLKKTATLFLFLSVLMLYSQQWKQNFKIVEPIRDFNNSFASSMSAYDGYVAFGSSQQISGFQNAGKVYIAKEDCDGWSIYQELTLLPAQNYCNFGSVIFMEGKTLAILGCDPSNPSKGNAIYMYERNANGFYIFTQKIVKSENVSGDNFGYKIAISNNYMVVGADYNSTDNSLGNYLENAGAAYIYFKDTNGVWSPVQKIVASDRKRRVTFGNSVAIYENTIVVGAVEEGSNLAGAAYVFEKNNLNVWNETKKLVAYDYRSLQDRFGYIVKINENGIFIAASRDDDYDSILSGDGAGPLTSLGSVYIFKKNSVGEWIGHQKLRASDGSANIFGFGDRMEIFKDQIAISGTEYEYDSGGNLSKVFGRVYMFQKEINDIWKEYQIVRPKNVEHSDDYFSNSISLYGKNLFVGAMWDKLDANDQSYISYAGAAYVFNTYEFKPQKPILNILPALTSCADLGNGFSSGFDTSLLENDLVLNSDNFIFSYKDQLGNVLPSPLPANYLNKFPYNEIINVRVENKNNSACYEDVQVELQTISPFALNVVPELKKCDLNGTGYAVFDLSKISNLLVQNPASYTFSYFDRDENDITASVNSTYINSNKNYEEITVRVTDINTACIEKTKIYLSVSDFGQDCNIEKYTIPNFFTPNGDGFNDLWEVTGFGSEDYSVYIYDRSGKLLKTLERDSAWDGNFNGTPLPSSDYWYQIMFENGNQKRGHFSLKR
ncbi:T9SS type B sorting domain-containing protein [Flavobacterium hercynium]|uniref:Uncharacterized protein n=1 Tax=Flavobacterium hercynium TaxID=387094 RepID=A0A226GYB3_9FLAO|nr:T9SS type B sorting domain-containing protein [Flavobacterium hercynium]OXA86411.1 hypothetical protein B0A66_18215 [Flavobacterium hercynium]SMP17273.1 gliding motility-associated C-terminal domain-containing protein [Flavobacterium hercynium]